MKKESDKSTELDLEKVDHIEFEGIDTKECPDFSDAFISSADYNGREMTDEELELLNENNDFVYEKLIDTLF